MTKITLVKITSSDLEELQKLGKQTFLETFAPVNTEENIQDYLQTGFTDEKLLKEITNPGSHFYFAKLNDKSIGYLKLNFGNAQTELQDSDAMEIERIYVLQEFHGQKAGQFLFSEALKIAHEHHLKYIWLGVWEKNEKAIKFYEKNGFIPFDKHSFVLGTDIQTDVMMKLPLNK
ncbi:GNAT family N-acetyltransferase [Dyadobacter sp. UP-52]|uniref:GNAT family N-acetyltransferase n=1 Tax=Dyadobacter subterraneus TaxID=2773304 RepID=A0ABR9WIC3_9BACT|nr:GNAT family N-acetyltransferase [Dyadobacter subterraneus]